MKFFIDENISPRLAEPLNAIYKHHEFGTATTEGTQSVLDLDLFEVIRQRGYDVIITKDRKQMRREPERRAIHDQQLHWVGYQMKSVAGIQGFAMESATIVAGLSYFLSDVKEQPHAYTVLGLNPEPKHRIRSERLWLPAWSNALQSYPYDLLMFDPLGLLRSLAHVTISWVTMPDGTQVEPTGLTSSGQIEGCTSQSEDAQLRTNSSTLSSDTTAANRPQQK